MEPVYPGKTSCAECISTPQLKITSIPPKHHSGTGCIDGIGCPLGRIDPKGKQWVITYQRGRCVGANWEWDCTTDVPIILFAYIGTRPPWKKAGTHVKRGIVTHHDPTVYFPYDLISCQNEGGEVIDHTFTWPSLPNQEVFWWRCGGRSGGLFPRWSASRSPFWNAKCGVAGVEHEEVFDADPASFRLRHELTVVPGNDPYCPDSVWCTNPPPFGDNVDNNQTYFHRQYLWGEYRWTVYRDHFRFNTALIPANATINWAYIRVYNKVEPDSADQSVVVTVPPFIPWTSINARNYYAQLVTSSEVAATFDNDELGYKYSNKDLNAAGLANITKEGYTHFGITRLKDRSRTPMPLGFHPPHYFILTGDVVEKCSLRVNYTTPT